MKNKSEENFAATSDQKKENLISRVVIKNFGEWSNFRGIIKNAWESVDYDPRENKLSQHRFTREILQGNADKIGYTDLIKLSNLIIKEIDVLERCKEKAEIKSEKKDESAKGKYVQRDIPFSNEKKG